MGLEFTRGNSARCPPFLVGGLMIMCLFLLCSWWSLSSQNFELLRHKDNLAEQLRINREKLNKCNHCQVQLAELEVQVKQVKDLDQELKMCQTEMESLKKVGESKGKTLEALRAEKSSLEKDLESEKEGFRELKKELKVKDERLSELEKELEEKRIKMIEMEKKITSLQLKNAPKLDMDQPIAKVLQKKPNKDGEPGNNEKVQKKDGKLENQESLHDDNAGDEGKMDDTVIEVGDPREEAMSQNANNVDN